MRSCIIHSFLEVCLGTCENFCLLYKEYITPVKHAFCYIIPNKKQCIVIIFREK